MKSYRFLLPLCFLSTCAMAGTVGTWTEPTILDRGGHTVTKGHTAIVIPSFAAESVFIMGGSDASLPQLRLHRYDHPNGNLTSLTPIVASQERTDHCAVERGGLMYVFGGLNAGSTALSNMFVYNPSTNGWSGSTNFPGAGRYGHACAVVGDSMYVFGGRTTAGAALSETLRFDFVGGAWSTLTVSGTPPSARHDLTFTTVGPCAYAIGGGDASGGSPHASFNDVHSFCPSGASGTWTPLSPAGTAPVRRYGHAATARGTRVVIFGGYAGVGSGLFPNDIFQDIHYYDTVTNAWHTPTVNAPLPGTRYEATFTALANETIMFGGVSGTGTTLSDLWVSDYTPLECDAGSSSADGITPCVPCAAGSAATSPGAYNCTECASGSYALGPGATSCDICPAGHFGNVSGQANATDACFECPLTTYLPQGPPLRGGGISECLPCPSGTFGNETGLGACYTCEEGYYSTGTGNGVCLPCPAGSFCTGGSITPCPATTEQPNGAQSTCTPCPAATWSPGGQPTCTPCGAGTFSLVNGTSAGICTQCPAGQWSSGTGQTSCQNCPQGTWSDQLGRTAAAQCTACPAGTYGPNAGQSNETLACLPCAAGSYSVTPGGATSCTLCAIGTYSTVPSATTPTVCTPCPDGSTSSVEGASSASECSACPAGSYASGGSCANCTAGTYNPSPGKTSGDACQPCPHNFISPEAAEQCFECAPGTFSVSGMASCETCDTTVADVFSAPDELVPGSGLDSDAVTTHGWTLTGPATLDATTGVLLPGRSDPLHAVRMQRSAAGDPEARISNAAVLGGATTGSYAFSVHVNANLTGGSAEDSDFAAVITATDTLANVQTVTVPLPTSTSALWENRRGFVANPGTMASISVQIRMRGAWVGVADVDVVSVRVAAKIACACDPGYYHDATDATLCHYCTLGSACPLSSRLPCTEGLYSMGGKTQCETCPAGRWCSDGRMYECAHGEYPTSSNSSSCTTCPAGSACPGGVLTTCEAGRYSTGGTHRCFECPAGSWQSAAGQSSCEPCPAGSFSGAATTEPTCSPCPRGHYSNAGSAQCTSCPPGHYASAAAASACLPCPANEYAEGPAAYFCTACPAGKTTPGTGSKSRYDCT